MGLYYPSSSPLFKESVVKVEAVLETFEPSSEITYDTEVGGLYKGKITKYTVSWSSQTDAVGYNVYASFSPITKNLLNNTVLPNTQLSYDFYPPIIPADFLLYFWVSKKLSDGSEIFLQIDPATQMTEAVSFDNYPITESQDIPHKDPVEATIKYVYEDIRRRHIFMLENGGEDAYVYIRKWYGTPCQCVDDSASDPDYQGRGRCVLCFGTGVIGGYYPKIAIKIRYQNEPTRDISFEKYGLKFDEKFNSWTLWSPRLHKHDIVVRKKSGQKYYVDDIGHSEIRGVPFRQGLKLSHIEQNDIRNQISDVGILEAFQKENQIGFMRFGWSIFS